MGGRRRIFCLTMKFMLLPLLCLTAGCRLISPYDHHAYTQTVSLKVESMFLMEKAREDCAKHKDAIENLSIKIETAYEYEKGRHKNEGPETPGTGKGENRPNQDGFDRPGGEYGREGIRKYCHGE